MKKSAHYKPRCSGGDSGRDELLLIRGDRKRLGGEPLWMVAG